MINQIIQGDCLEVMKDIPDNSIDAIITDPPYGMRYQSSRRTASEKFLKIVNDDNIDFIPLFAKESFRVLKDNTHTYLFCNDYAISDFHHFFSGAGFIVKRTLVWVKNNHTSGDLLGDYANKTEFVLYLHKGRRELNGSRDTNVLLFNRVFNLLHPTQKPVDMMEYLVAKSTNEGETVLDPFLGSGTTAIACQNLNRNWIGIEISPEYCEIARNRLYGELFKGDK